MQAKLQGDARFSASDFFKKAGISGGQLTRIAIIVFSHDLFDRVFSRLSLSGTKFPYDGNFREGINTGLDTTLVEICTGILLRLPSWRNFSHWEFAEYFCWAQQGQSMKSCASMTWYCVPVHFAMRVPAGLRMRLTII